MIGDDHKVLGISEEETALPMSQRKLFLGAVINSASFTKVRSINSKALMDIAIPSPMELEGRKPWCSGNLHALAVVDSIKENGGGLYTGTLKLIKFLPLELGENPQLVVGTFSIDYNISPIEDPLKQKVSVLKAYNLQWVETAQSHMSLAEQETIASDIAEWSYSILVQSQLRDYLFRDKDNEKMLRSLYKEDCRLPSIDAPLSELVLALDAEMKRFWQEFYLTNKHLFSDKLL